MATSILRRCISHQLRLPPVYRQVPYSNGTYVLMPEIPPDTPETNPVLRLSELPKFSEVTLEQCMRAVGKGVLVHKLGLEKLENSLKDGSLKPNLPAILDHIEEMQAPLDYAWASLRHMYIIKHGPQIEEMFRMLSTGFHKTKSLKYQSEPLYHAMKDLAADGLKLSPPERRILQKYLLESRLGGLELGDGEKKELNRIMGKLESTKRTFREKLKKSSGMFKHTIRDPTLVKNFPSTLLRLLAGDSSNTVSGPWTVTLKPAVYHQFMQYCSDRDLRWNAWNSWIKRATQEHMNNSVQLEEIRGYRFTEAKLLGYPQYVDLSMETKMAANCDNVRSMMTSLLAHTKPAMTRELDSLHQFATERGFEGRLEMWDVPYYRRRELKAKFGFDNEALRDYFPLPKVLEGLHSLCHKLFGVTIKEGQADVWHQDVKFYNIYEKDKLIGSFYLDPYSRPGKLHTDPLMQIGRSTSAAVDAQPLAYIVCNFPPPILGQPSLLSIEDLRGLFGEYGHALQHLMTTMKYSDVSGQTNIEWDAVDVCSHFMRSWLSHPAILMDLSCHVEHGKPLDQETINNIEQARCHMAGFDFTYQLYLSALDLELYSGEEFWVQIIRRLWPEHLPFTQDRRDAHPLSMSAIVSESYAAAYYCNIWAEMIAADIFSAFQEVGLNNEKEVKALGQKFRETFLSLGGGCHPSEVFRTFRGRDPSPNALLAFYRLK